MTLYLFGGRQCLEPGCLGDHGVAVSRAGLQRQGEARDGVDTHLDDGNLVVCDREGRLSQHGVHGQRRLHLRGRDAPLLFCPRDSGSRLRSGIDNSFIVSVELIKAMTSQFQIRVLCAVGRSSGPRLHVSPPHCLSW